MVTARGPDAGRVPVAVRRIGIIFETDEFVVFQTMNGGGPLKPEPWQWLKWCIFANARAESLIKHSVTEHPVAE